MARLTATDMVAIARDCLGGETSETLSDARILRFLNQSYLELCSRYHYDQLSTSTTITTASGTSEYELSVSDVLEISVIVDDTNNNKLYTMSEYQYHTYVQGSTSSGSPDSWYIDGVGSNNRWNLMLYPTPAGTYTLNVYYTKEPTELVLSPTATSPIIPSAWDDSIIYKAVSRGWAQLGDLEASEKWKKLSMVNDSAAYKSTYHPSQRPDRMGSIVGRALRNA